MYYYFYFQNLHTAVREAHADQVLQFARNAGSRDNSDVVIIAGDLVMGSKVRACPLKLNYYYMLEYLCDNKRGDGAAQLVFKIELVQYM